MRIAARRVSACLLALLLLAPAGAAEQLLPNGSFETGDAAPAGWTLRGEGEWLDEGAAAGGRAISVRGSGTDHGFWQSAKVALEPGELYVLRLRARSLGSTGGTAVSGPGFCNRDLGKLPEDWTAVASHFVVPADVPAGGAGIRLGQWHVDGRVAFDDVRLAGARAVHSRHGGLALGAGESLRPGPDGGCRYRFALAAGPEAGNHCRPLARHTADYNTNRWCFGAGEEVVFRHAVGDRSQRDARVEVGVCYHTAGELALAVSPDGKDWRELGTVGGVGADGFDLPADLLPAEAVWVRLAARPVAGGKGCNLQIADYAYTAAVSGPAAAVAGRTHYLTVARPDPRVGLDVEALGECIPGGRNEVVLRLTNTTKGRIGGTVSLSVTGPEGGQTSRRRELDLPPGEAAAVRIPYELDGTGLNVLRIAGEDGLAFAAEMPVAVPALHDASYGHLLGGDTPAVRLWGCSSGWKVSRTRPAPKSVPRGKPRGLLLHAAGGEAEACQLVVRPEAPLEGFRVEPRALRGPGKALIPADAVEVLRVGYVPVTQPTDATGAVGDWPDPLPPLNAPRELDADRNQPLWVRVTVPRGTPPGRYEGTVELRGSGFAADVPLAVEVFGFDLPETMTCKTSFGLNHRRVWRYHKVRSEADRRKVTAAYLQALSRNHISPYDPAPMDRFTVSWPNAEAWDGGTRDRVNPRAGKACLKVHDASRTANVSAGCDKAVAIPEGGLRLRLHYRTAEKGHRFIVSLNHLDAAGRWMSGRNRDIPLTGSTEWRQFDRTFRDFPDGAESVRLTLWATRYAEPGRHTGTVWYDDVSLTPAGAAESANLLPDGTFEPARPEQLVPVFDFSAWDRAMTRAIEVYHFNTFMARIEGLGGGTFHARYEPGLLGYAEGTPEYRAAFTNYCRTFQEHLREKGWLDEAYVYWFDEPAPKDYAFVMNGFRKLKAAAPDLTRMLTEQVEDGLIGGPNLWCPVSSNYDHDRAEARREHGERFWWYVCTGPKAPFCTLFIDHPATEMRVWLWQTFKRKISGVLVWDTVYWTSSAAYPDPDHPQNPYADPMGWVSGYSTPAGVRRPWGNGDGRFLYPPEAAATGRQDREVLDPPVSSIRLEMLRDGIEDYEYLAMLTRLLAAKGDGLPAARRRAVEALTGVPPEITRTMTDFTHDPAPIEARRKRLGEAIEELLAK